MVFYKTKRTSFVTILALTIISWALMLSYYIYSSYIGLDTMILPIVFVLVSIFFYNVSARKPMVFRPWDEWRHV